MIKAEHVRSRTGQVEKRDGQTVGRYEELVSPEKVEAVERFNGARVARYLFESPAA